MAILFCLNDIGSREENKKTVERREKKATMIHGYSGI